MKKLKLIVDFLQAFTLVGDSNNNCIVILKPDFPQIQKLNFISYCNMNSLDISTNRKIILTSDKIFGIYYGIFKQREDDRSYGVSWKLKLIEYLRSGKSDCYLVSGENAQNLMKDYKQVIRKKYNKITAPKEHLSEHDFNEKVIKNLIHVTEESEFVPTCWFIFK